MECKKTYIGTIKLKEWKEKQSIEEYTEIGEDVFKWGKQLCDVLINNRLIIYRIE